MSEKKGDNRSRISIWIDALRRAYIWSFIADKKGMILLTEYPKSGGTWVCQMLSEYTDLPFQRNERARIIPSILHGHRSYSKSFKNVVCVIRDGRDIMVSAYYHFLFSNDKNNNSYMYAMQKKMPFDDFDNIKRNMPQFIKFMFTEKPNLVYNDNWSQFVTGWHGKDVNYVRYEQLLIDPVKELSPVLEKITGLKIDIVKLQNTIEKFSFKNLTNRKPGEENTSSFIRKGIAGDWKNVFNNEAKLIFDKYAGKELILLGYEKDNSWVSKG